jgi:uncharacterized membrane protein
MFDFYNHVKLLISAIVFVSIDSIYLNFIKNYFSKQIEIIQKTPIQINFLATLLSYIFLIFGINYFIIKPNRSIQDAFLLGLVIYGVFETTSKALFAKWTWTTVIIDTLWGGILFALTTYILQLIHKKII